MAVALQTPSADLALVYSANADGTLTVDLATTPAGDLKLVTGTARLVQDVTRWLLTPQGSVQLEPTYGNPLFSELGRPAGAPDTVFLAMMQQAEDAFLTRQADAAAQGYLTLDEQVDHFEDNRVAVDPASGTVVVSFTVVARSGAAAPLAAPLSVRST